MSLPERTGWIFALPGLDCILLITSLVMLTGAIASESYLSVELAPSEFRGVRLGEERPVVVMLKSTSSGPAYYLDSQEIPEESLKGAIQERVEERGIQVVAIEIDQRASMADRFRLINILTDLELRILEGYRRRAMPEDR